MNGRGLELREGGGSQENSEVPDCVTGWKWGQRTDLGYAKGGAGSGWMTGSGAERLRKQLEVGLGQGLYWRMLPDVTWEKDLSVFIRLSHWNVTLAVLTLS